MEVIGDGEGALDRVTCQHANAATLPRIEEPNMSPQIETPSNDDSDPSDGESLRARDITAEDAQSIFQVSISRAATHLTSSKTPAAEKEAAFEDRPEGYFDVDSVIKSRPEASTPPGVIEDNDAPEETERGRIVQKSRTLAPKSNLTLDKPIDPKSQDQGLLSPGHAGSKNGSMASRLAESRLALQEAFSPLRKRSLSGSGDALKKFLPKGLPSMPSMPKASSFMPSAPSFFSSHMQSKNNGRTMSLQGSGVNDSVPKSNATRHKRSSTMFTQGQSDDSVRPPLIRRVTSQDDSLLYHTPSRSSSLGDDSRWVNVSEQVNSRGKAIFDSFSDRDFFKIPSVNMPSMPNILPGLPGVKKSGTSPSPSNRKAEVESPTPLPEDPLDRALLNMTGDIVVMGGYRGSVLRSAKTHRQVWVPVKIGLNIRKVNLEVGLEPEDEEKMEETIYPSGMLQNIGPVDISKRLFKRLRDSPNAKNGTLRVHDYGYDWRLSPHLLSKQLVKFLEGLQCNQKTIPRKDRGAFLISHSLGGLITRHAINQRPELVSGVIYAGVPHACVNILGPFRNGDAVLFSSRVLTAQVNFTLRTSFVLLPEDGRCFKDIKTGEEYPVNFFDPNEWVKYRWSPCTDPPLPPILPNQTPLGNLINMSSSLTSLPLIGIKKSTTTTTKESEQTKTTMAANLMRDLDGGKDRTLAVNMSGSGSGDGINSSQSQETNPYTTSNTTPPPTTPSTSAATHVTIPRSHALTYLHRILPQILTFKRELHFLPQHSSQNLYPPAAIIYGKDIPTCSGAKVLGREGIACSDSYDNLAFGSGDGVVLAREAMLPEGYHCVKGGRVGSDRGHVTLLGDLRAVGRAMEAVGRGRGRGIGVGLKGEGEEGGNLEKEEKK